MFAHNRELFNQNTPAPRMPDLVERVTIKSDRLVVATRTSSADRSGQMWSHVFEIPWAKPNIGKAQIAEASGSHNNARRFEQSVQLIVRAHAWLKLLTENHFGSVETLAKSIGLHPKVVRQQIQLAFVDPRAISTALNS
jgi:hypothetical protein